MIWPSPMMVRSGSATRPSAWKTPNKACPAGPSGRTAICRIGADGTAVRVIDMAQPAGLAFSPDGRTFYASQTPEHGEGEVAIFAFDRHGDTLSNRRLFARVPQAFPMASPSTGAAGCGAVRKSVSSCSMPKPGTSRLSPRRTCAATAPSTPTSDGCS
jgi:hypothetical protein